MGEHEHKMEGEREKQKRLPLRRVTANKNDLGSRLKSGQELASCGVANSCVICM